MSARKVLIFGNSGSGKSTLAHQLAEAQQLAHLDLDTLAWLPTNPPTRREKLDSAREITSFIHENSGWIVEGGYTDLLEIAQPFSTEIVFLDLPIEECVKNARSRPWEPHKYESKAAQDANLEFLIDWIRQYTARNDVFSRRAHADLYRNFDGKKQLITSNRRSD